MASPPPICRHCGETESEHGGRGMHDETSCRELHFAPGPTHEDALIERELSETRDAAHATIAILLAENEKLRRALEPFAAAWRLVKARAERAETDRIAWPGDFVGREAFRLADEVSPLKKPAVQP
jgi:hypothetical protein